MKRSLLFLLFLFTVQIQSQVFCDSDGVLDGMTTVDLTVFDSQVIAATGQPAGTPVYYYLNLADAESSINPIANTMAYFTSSGSVWGKAGLYTHMITIDIQNPPVVAEMVDVTTCDYYVLQGLLAGNYYTGPNGTGNLLFEGDVITVSMTVYIFNVVGSCSAESSFTVTINNAPVPQLQDGSICVDWTTGSVVAPYVLDSGLSSQFAHEWSLNGVLIPGVTGNTLSATMEGVYSVYAFDTVGCFGQASALVTLSSPPVLVSIIIDDQNVSVTINGFGDYIIVLDSGPIMSIFNYIDLPLGIHDIMVTDLNGCGSISATFEIVTPNAPLGATTQTFTEGQTLADLVVTGQNILWYANPSSTGKMVDTPLPLTTLLVNGTTYYASQTINGVESTDRLPVTVTTSLAVNENAFSGFIFHPNPVVNILNISNTINIDSIKIFNLLGQVIYETKSNATVSQVDLSGVNAGVYLVKVQSNNAEKTFRIIKE